MTTALVTAGDLSLLGNGEPVAQASAEMLALLGHEQTVHAKVSLGFVALLCDPDLSAEGEFDGSSSFAATLTWTDAVRSTSPLRRRAYLTPVAGAEPSILLADFWDPNRRDFASITRGMDPVDAQVVLALSTVRGSGASVAEDGMEPPGPKMSDTLPSQMESAARRALSRLVRGGDIRIVRVTLSVNDQAGNTAELLVEYRNLRADAVRLASVPLLRPRRL